VRSVPSAAKLLLLHEPRRCRASRPCSTADDVRTPRIVRPSSVRAEAELPLLELFRRQLMPRQQLVEVCPVAFRQSCRLAHITTGDLQNL
jgi:hypothetical protein